MCVHSRPFAVENRVCMPSRAPNPLKMTIWGPFRSPLRPSRPQIRGFFTTDPDSKRSGRMDTNCGFPDLGTPTSDLGQSPLVLGHFHPIFRVFRVFRSFFLVFGRPGPVANHFRSRKRPPQPFSTPKCPSRGPFCEIGIARHRETGIKPISRSFLAGPPAPYSPIPQPVAPLTRLRLFAILLPVRRKRPAT